MNKNYQILIGGLVLVGILAAGLLFYFHSQKSKMPVPGDLTDEPASISITYTDAGFSPSYATGTEPSVVVFKNNSSKPFQPVNDSSLHPEQGSCKAAENGACGPIPIGGSWSAEFVASVWRYHDKLDPSKTVIIEIQSLRSPVK